MRVDTQMEELRFQGAERKYLVLRFPRAEVSSCDRDHEAVQLIIDTGLYNWGEFRSSTPRSVGVRLDRSDLEFLLSHQDHLPASVVKLGGKDGIALEVNFGAKNTSQDLPVKTCVFFSISGLVLPPDFRVSAPDLRLSIAMLPEMAKRLFDALADLQKPVADRTLTAGPKPRTPTEQLADEAAWSDYQFAA